MKLIGNFETDGSVSCITNTDGELCLFLCKERVENVNHFLLDCPNFRYNHEPLWPNLSRKEIICNLSEGKQISRFLVVLYREQKILLLMGATGWGGVSSFHF